MQFKVGDKVRRRWERVVGNNNPAVNGSVVTIAEITPHYYGTYLRFAEGDDTGGWDVDYYELVAPAPTPLRDFIVNNYGLTAKELTKALIEAGYAKEFPET